jgi:hypothetical protein
VVWCVSFYSLIRFTLYCLTWSLRFLVSEFFCKRLFTIPNTCSITASCLKSSLPWNCGKKVAFTIKKNYMFTHTITCVNLSKTKFFYSEGAWPNGLKHGRKHLWKVLYGNCSFRFDPLTNIMVGYIVDYYYSTSYIQIS